MDTVEKNLNDFVEYLSGINRENSPKKAKPLKNYITGLNGKVIYNF